MDVNIIDVYKRQGYDGADVDFSIDYIKDMLDLSDGRTVDGKHTPGVYEVGAGKDLEPGLYYVEGDLSLIHI